MKFCINHILLKRYDISLTSKIKPRFLKSKHFFLKYPIICENSYSSNLLFAEYILIPKTLKISHTSVTAITEQAGSVAALPGSLDEALLSHSENESLLHKRKVEKTGNIIVIP